MKKQIEIESGGVSTAGLIHIHKLLMSPWQPEGSKATEHFRTNTIEPPAISRVSVKDPDIERFSWGNSI
jgi:hypothetical protein